MPQSLPGRLALLFSLLATIALASMGAYSYYALQAQLLSRDEEIVRGKLEQVTHLIEELDGTGPVASWPHRLDDIVRGHDGLAIRLRTEQGVLRYRTRDTLPADFDLEAGRRSVDLRQSFVMRGAVIERAGGDKTPARLTVAQSSQGRAQVITRFQNSLLAGTAVGAILTAMLGALITRRELQPTQRLVKQVNRISVEQLSYRVDAPARPIEVRAIATAFNAMLQRLESGYERLYRFSADLAHDMRTPLNNLIGHAEVALSKERTAAEYEALIEESLAEYQRLSRMIDGMLFLARADGANTRIETVVISLADELVKLTDYFSVLAEERAITFSVNAKGRLKADAMLFRRAINNLLANAIEHADSGSTVCVQTVDAESDILVQVSNVGQPIPEKDVPHIFERFYRADRARSHSYRSTGLGLAIVRSIMELHGGTATARTLAGRVTQFELRFPGSGRP